MKKILTFILLYVGVTGHARTVSAAQISNIASTLTEVTVYTDRARVVRTGSKQVAAGTVKLTFSELPMQLDQHSIQVTGSGDAVLKDVKIVQSHTATFTDAQMRALVSQVQRFTRKQTALEDKISHARSEKSFVERIATTITGKNESDTPPELNPQKWMQMVSFYRSKFDALDAEIRTAELAQAVIKDTLISLNKKILELGDNSQKSSTSVTVTLEVPQPTKLTLSLIYIIYGPSWEPLYDIRVITAQKKMELAYNARVRQATGEDWKNVVLKLSTAQPHIGGNCPDLASWQIDFQRPRPVLSESGYGAGMRLSKSVAAPAMARQSNVEVLAAPLQVATAVVETRGTAAVFTVEGKSIVKGDNAPHKVAIMTKMFEPEFVYTAVPKLAPYVYLRASTKNTTEYPLLAGAVGIFLDNNYVGTSRLEYIAPNASFHADLGIDKGIDVSYRLVKKYRAKEGLVNKRDKILYKYLITLTNSKKTDEQIRVQDQIPLSSDQDISVELVTPEISKETKMPHKNTQGFITWEYTLKAGEKKDIPLIFSVEYPQGRQVIGID